MKKILVLFFSLIALISLGQNPVDTRILRFKMIQPANAADTAAVIANRGKMWFDFNTNEFRYNKDGINRSFGSGSGSGISSANNGLSVNSGIVGLGGIVEGITSITNDNVNGSTLYISSENFVNTNVGTSFIQQQDNIGVSKSVIATSSERLEFTDEFGASDVKFYDTSNGDGILYDQDYSLGFTSRSLVDLGYVLGTKTYTGKQFFTANTTNSGISVGTTATDPSILNNGDLWYTAGSINRLSAFVGGVIQRLGDVSSSSTSADGNALARFDGNSGKLIKNSLITVSDDVGGVTIQKNSITDLRILAGLGNNQAMNDLILQGGSFAQAGGTVGHTYVIGGKNNANTITGNVGFHIDAPTSNSFGGGSKVMQIGNAITEPVNSPPDGVLLWAFDNAGSAELKVRDEAGNVTTLSPHNFSIIGQFSEPGAFSHYSEYTNPDTGKREAINIDMLKLARLLEQLTGEKLVYKKVLDR